MTNFSQREVIALLHSNPDLAINGDDEDISELHIQVHPHTVMVVPVRIEQPKRATLEFALQASIIARVDLRAYQDPVWKRVMAVPNGQYRRGQRLEPGTRKGVLNLQWPLRRGQYVGLVMELKCGDNPTTPEQDDWIE
jgi:hypothetical protein